MRRRDFDQVACRRGVRAKQALPPALVLLFAVQLPSIGLAQDGIDRVTGFVREPVHVAHLARRQEGRGSASRCSSRSSASARARCSARISRAAIRTSSTRLSVNMATTGASYASAGCFKEVGCTAQRRAEGGVCRRLSVGVEGIPRGAAERADHRPWPEHHQPYAAARAWPCRAEGPTSTGRWT